MFRFSKIFCTDYEDDHLKHKFSLPSWTHLETELPHSASHFPPYSNDHPTPYICPFQTYSYRQIPLHLSWFEVPEVSKQAKPWVPRCQEAERLFRLMLLSLWVWFLRYHLLADGNPRRLGDLTTRWKRIRCVKLRSLIWRALVQFPKLLLEAQNVEVHELIYWLWLRLQDKE